MNGTVIALDPVLSSGDRSRTVVLIILIAVRIFLDIFQGCYDLESGSRGIKPLRCPV